MLKRTPVSAHEALLLSQYRAQYPHITATWRRRQARTNAAWLIGTVLFLVMLTCALSFYAEYVK